MGSAARARTSVGTFQVSIGTAGLALPATAVGPAPLGKGPTLAVVLRSPEAGASPEDVERGGFAADFGKKLLMPRWPIVVRKSSVWVHLWGTAWFEKSAFGEIRRADASVKRSARDARLCGPRP